MEQTFYRDHLKALGINTVIPDDQDRAEIHRIIFEELCVGMVSNESHQTFVEVIERLEHEGCDGVILGCTEIELLISKADSPLPLFPHHPSAHRSRIERLNALARLAVTPPSYCCEQCSSAVPSSK